MCESFLLAWRSLVRGHVLLLLITATGLVHLLAPSLVRSDGTADGWREMFVRVVPGSVFTFTVIALLGCACGMFARERELNRLALTAVRPVSGFTVGLGKLCALVLVAVTVFGFNASLLLARGGWTDCRHVIVPALPSTAVVARAAMEDYLRDPKTPEAVRKASKRSVLSLLANKELDRYDTIPAGGIYSWPFTVPAAMSGAGNGCHVRVRFATLMDLRSAVTGCFSVGVSNQWNGVVSNSTQSVIDVPLACQTGGSFPVGAVRLSFHNTGKNSVMLRPRRDLEFLVSGDAFAWNAVRATVEMCALAVFLCAFGLFLSSALSRPVALFTAFVAVLVVVMAPNVIAQFPDGLDVALSDRLGLWISRAVSAVASVFADPSPVSDLATGRCIEREDMFLSLVFDGMLAPVVFLAAAAAVIRRKPLGL